MACIKCGVSKVGEEVYIMQFFTTLHALLGVVNDNIATCVDSTINISICEDIAKLCDSAKSRLVVCQSSISNCDRILMEDSWSTLIKETKSYQRELGLKKTLPLNCVFHQFHS
jgi:hypothetical protein